MSHTQQKKHDNNCRDNFSQMNRMVNNGEEDSVNRVPLTCNRNVEEPSQESDAYTRLDTEE